MFTTAPIRKFHGSSPTQFAESVRRAVCFGLAGACLVTAMAGVLLPLLPATPFALLGSFFLLRASPTWNRRLLRSRWFGPILRDWHRHRGVRRDVKVRAVLTVVATTALSWWLAPSAFFVRLILLAGSVTGIVAVCRLPSVTDPLSSSQTATASREDYPQASMSRQVPLRPIKVSA